MPIKTGVVTNTDNIKQLAAALRTLAGIDLLVGIPSDNEQPHQGIGVVGRNQRQGAATQGAMNNATLGYIHEKGSPAANIPARPWLEPGVKAAGDKITKRLRDAGAAALSGNKSAVDKNVVAAGIEAVSSVKRTVQAGLQPGLKPATVTARRRRSKGSKYRRKAATSSGVTPLIDTAQMINATSFVVRKKP